MLPTARLGLQLAVLDRKLAVARPVGIRQVVVGLDRDDFAATGRDAPVAGVTRSGDGSALDSQVYLVSYTTRGSATQSCCLFERQRSDKTTSRSGHSSPVASPAATSTSTNDSVSAGNTEIGRERPATLIRAFPRLR